jgi:hypothetical protein
MEVTKSPSLNYKRAIKLVLANGYDLFLVEYYCPFRVFGLYNILTTNNIIN